MRERANQNKGLKTLKRFLALQGTALFALSLMAGVSDSITMRVTPRDVWGPNAVLDLGAVARNEEGQVLLTWTAPSDYLAPAVPVQQYEIRHASFSVADVGGSTTTWWSLAVPFIPVPAIVPGAPGSAEFAIVTGLPAQLRYFGIVSYDASGNRSALDAGSTGGAQASATPRGNRPAPVSGLMGFANPDSSYNTLWNPVTQNEDGSTALDISSYVVRRAGSFRGPFGTVAVTNAVGASNPSFGESSMPSSEQYLQILARDDGGNESDPAKTNLFHVTPQGIIGQVAVAADGSDTRAYVPSTLMGELRTIHGDLLVNVAPNTTPALNRDTTRTLATYDVKFVSPAQAVDNSFTFSRPAMTVVLQYQPPSASLPNQTVGVLWWNGTSWIKVGAAEVDATLRTASFRTALPGTYQVRQFQAATELTLEKANVFPRIFTPNGDGVNDEVLFVIENPRLSSIDAKIYDVQGLEVSDMRPAGAGAPTADTMSWNGRDRNGSLVPAGVYIYRIKGEGKSITGTIVVAK